MTAITRYLKIRARIAAVISGHHPAPRPSVRARIRSICIFGTVA